MANFVYSLPVTDGTTVLVSSKKIELHSIFDDVPIGSCVLKSSLCPKFPYENFRTVDGKVYREIQTTWRPMSKPIHKQTVVICMERIE